MYSKTIYIGSDHGGFKFKGVLCGYLSKKGYRIEDVGPFALDPDDDYPDYAVKVCRKVLKDKSRGILICRSGGGMCIAANKFPGIYAEDCWDAVSASYASKHQGANVLSLGMRWTKPELAKKIVMTWIETPFEGGRHERRMKKIRRLEKRTMKMVR